MRLTGILIIGAASIAILFGGSSCGVPVWTPASVPACAISTGDAHLDRERSYLALLLALDQRGYAVKRTDKGFGVTASYASSYRPGAYHTEWTISILADGSTLIDALEFRKQPHKKTRNWLDQLTRSVVQLQCRELNWLRWEAQNRGLVSLAGAGAGSVSIGQEAGSGTAGASSAVPGADGPGSELQQPADGARQKPIDATH